MKGQAKATDLFCIIMVILILGLFFTFIFPSFVDNIFNELAKSSAEVVGRQVSGLITLVASSLSDKTKLSTKFSEDIKYSLTIEQRAMTIIPHFKAGFAEKTSSTVLLGIELGKHSFDEISGLAITKNLVGSGDKSFTSSTQDSNFEYKVEKL
jgi:hypothetical protein